MKKAEDFRKAFGPVTPGFESAAKETIRELRAKETQKKRRTAGEWLRYRRPVLAMAMALVLFIGFLAVNDTLNLSGHTDEIRTGRRRRRRRRTGGGRGNRGGRNSRTDYAHLLGFHDRLG